MPVHMKKKLSAYSTSVSYTLAFHGVTKLKEPYILSIYFAHKMVHTTAEAYLYQNRTNEDAYTYYTYGPDREPFVTILLKGGKGDQALARFEETDGEVFSIIKGIAIDASQDAIGVGILCDKLQEMNHWICRLIERWRDKAFVPFKTRRQPKEKPVKPSLFDMID